MCFVISLKQPVYKSISTTIDWFFLSLSVLIVNEKALTLGLGGPSLTTIKLLQPSSYQLDKRENYAENLGIFVHLRYFKIYVLILMQTFLWLITGVVRKNKITYNKKTELILQMLKKLIRKNLVKNCSKN